MLKHIKMKIGIPKEIKNNEDRVAITPEGVAALCQDGHQVIVEYGAGLGSDFDDHLYRQAGAGLVETDAAWDVDLVVKVKEPQPTEYKFLAKQMVFTFFHLSGVDKRLTKQLMLKGTTAIAYESLEDKQGRLPILAPMSAVAGNMSVLMGAYYLARFNQGRGMQLGRILGRQYGKVLIIGDGTVGQHAARVAAAMGADVTIAGLNEKKWRAQIQGDLADVDYIESNPRNIAAKLPEVDLLVGAVLCRGAKATKVLTEAMVKTMRDGAVVVDVSIDQGGCFETSKPTTHSKPVFIKHGVIHYCVTNMPGAYPKAATMALTEASLSYIRLLALAGLDEFCKTPGQAKAINIYQGNIVYQQVAQDLNLLERYQPLKIKLK